MTSISDYFREKESGVKLIFSMVPRYRLLGRIDVNGQQI
jgi:hypothetical protein